MTTDWADIAGTVMIGVATSIVAIVMIGIATSILVLLFSPFDGDDFPE